MYSFKLPASPSRKPSDLVLKGSTEVNGAIPELFQHGTPFTGESRWRVKRGLSTRRLQTYFSLEEWCWPLWWARGLQPMSTSKSPHRIPNGWFSWQTRYKSTSNKPGTNPSQINQVHTNLKQRTWSFSGHGLAGPSLHSTCLVGSEGQALVDLDFLCLRWSFVSNKTKTLQGFNF